MVQDFVALLGVEREGVLVLFLALLFLGGLVLDWVSLVLILVPIFLPLLRATGFDAVWMGVLAVIVIQTSYLTPPMAPSIFYLRGVAPAEISYGDMCRGVLPFVACQGLTLLAVVLFPMLATWLPSLTRAY
jgi:TRAP-type mannitol/chloroaromatic compound transport system permease large subunit